MPILFLLIRLTILPTCVTQQEDAIALWKEVCSGPLLAGSTLILILNKVHSTHADTSTMTRWIS